MEQLTQSAANDADPVPPFKVEVRTPGAKHYRAAPAKHPDLQSALAEARTCSPTELAGIRVVDGNRRVLEQVLGGRPVAR